MEKSASRKQVIERYSNPSNWGLGLLAVAFQTLFSRSIDNDHSAKRWIAAKKVAHKLGTTPLEILVLDVPTAMMPEKSKELIENPSNLFGTKYETFLKFARAVTKNNEKALRVSPKIFTPELLAEMDISGSTDESNGQIIINAAVTKLRDKLPYLTGKGKKYDQSLDNNIYYEKVARQTVNGIFSAFKELVDNGFPTRNIKDKQYKEKVAFLAGLSAIEVLFIPKKNHRFKHLLIGSH